MTPRQIIRSKCETALWLVLIVLAMFVALAILEPGPGYGWIYVVLFFAFLGVASYANWIIACPKCHLPFGQMVWNVAYPSLSIMPFKVCPHCSLPLDRPWPADKG
jgi:hypothetical protein